MKAEFKEENISNVYPKLMIDEREGEKKLIILFTKPGAGTVVFSENTDYPIGMYSDTWANWYFRDFTGDLTLSN